MLNNNKQRIALLTFALAGVAILFGCQGSDNQNDSSALSEATSSDASQPSDDQDAEKPADDQDAEKPADVQDAAKPADDTAGDDSVSPKHRAMN